MNSFLFIYFLYGCFERGICDQVPLPIVDQVSNPQTYNIDPNLLPVPFATDSVRRRSETIPQPYDATFNVPSAFKVNVFSSGDPPNSYKKPRQMAVASNGDVFLTDMDAAAGSVYILRDENEDGVADQRFTFATGLIKPFGLAFNAGFLYVADVHSVVRFQYEAGQVKASSGPEKIANLTKDGMSIYS